MGGQKDKKIAHLATNSKYKLRICVGTFLQTRNPLMGLIFVSFDFLAFFRKPKGSKKGQRDKKKCRTSSE